LNNPSAMAHIPAASVSPFSAKPFYREAIHVFLWVRRKPKPSNPSAQC
jgi:hypothetical protein